MAEISGLESIPNQPFVFNEEVPCQPCSNVSFCNIVHEDDYVEIQIQQNPCATNLICDTPFGLGPELIEDTLFDQYGDDEIVNGDFASGASWTQTPPEFTISGGKARTIAGPPILTTLTQTIASPTQQEWHRLQLELSNVTPASGALKAYLYDSGAEFGPQFPANSNGIHSGKVLSGNTNSDFVLFVLNLSGVSFVSEIDNVVLRRICPKWRHQYDTLNGSWEPSEPGYTHIPSVPDSAYPLFYDLVIPFNTQYIAQITVVGRTAGSVQVVGANGTPSTAIADNGTFTVMFTSGTDVIFPIPYILPTTNFDGTITYFSLKEVTTCFDLDDTWTVTEDGDLCSGGNSSTLSLQGIPIIAGGYYQIQFEITNYFSGSIQMSVGGDVGASFSGNGIHTDYITATNDGTLEIIPSADFIGCIKSSNLSLIRLYSSITVDLLKNGVYEADLTNLAVPYKNVFNLKFKPSDILNEGGQPLVDGCYSICAHSPCEEEIPFFESEFEPAGGWTDNPNGLVVTGTGSYTYTSLGIDPPSYLGSSAHAVVALANRTYQITIIVASSSGSNCLIQIQMGGGTLNFYPGAALGAFTGTFTVPSNGITLQVLCQKLQLTDSTMEIESIEIIELQEVDEQLCSNCFKLFTGEIPCDTHLFEGYSATNNLGFNFDSSFVLRQRLLSKRLPGNYPEEGEVYTDTQGSSINPYSRSQKLSTIFVEMVPEYLHDFIRAVRKTGNFSIDSVAKISPPNEYAPLWNSDGSFNLAPSIFEVYDKSKNTIYNFPCE